MEITVKLIVELIVLFKQLHVVMDARNLWTLAAMTALLLKGKHARLYELGKALPCDGKDESRVQKIRRWLSNSKITPEQFLAARIAILAPFLAQLPGITLIIDRTERKRLGVHINLFICSIAFKGRSFPLFWILLSKRGCSSLDEQKALLTPVLKALAADPILSKLNIKVLADREFCSPKLPKWLKRSFGVRFGIRVKKNYRVSRPDIPSTPISAFLKHCQRGECYFFPNVLLTSEHRFCVNLFIYWRDDCEGGRCTILHEKAALEIL